MTINIAQLETKSFRGGFRLQRKGGGKARVLHPTFEKAESEARRLIGLHPEATFVIMQEVARVKAALADPDAATGCSDDQTFGGVPS